MEAETVEINIPFDDLPEKDKTYLVKELASLELAKEEENYDLVGAIQDRLQKFYEELFNRYVDTGNDRCSE